MATKRPTQPQPHTPKITAAKALSRLRRLHEQLPELLGEGRTGTLISTWPKEVESVLADYYGQSSLKFQQFNQISYYPSFGYMGMPDSERVAAFISGTKEAEAFLKSRIAELEEDLGEQQTGGVVGALQASTPDRHKVFVVHGHDSGVKESVGRYLSKLGLEPIILHEQPNEGRTLIEKFEHNADVGCAVVLLTADDTGSSKASPSVTEKRARQNVVFEMGFFLGRLGRKHTIALLEHGVSKPSDIDGVVYIPLDDESWKLLLIRELKAAGMQIDANRAFN